MAKAYEVSWSMIVESDDSVEEVAAEAWGNLEDAVKFRRDTSILVVRDLDEDRADSYDVVDMEDGEIVSSWRRGVKIK